MWQRFTERARRTVFFAQEEAGRLGENHVSTEHLLLGLVRENDTVAARILNMLQVPVQKVRQELERQLASGEERQSGQDIQLTPRAKRVIDLAYDEARQLNNNYIGTEHLLLGVVREGEGIAARVLSKLGVDLQQTRRVVLEIQDASRAENTPDAGGASKETSRFASAAEEIRRHFAPEESSESTEEEPVRKTFRPGDFGVTKTTAGRDYVELALSEETYVMLLHTYQAKDRHGYQELRASGEMVLLSGGVQLKRLVAPIEGRVAASLGGVFVRVLSGEHARLAGWIFADAVVERTGPDDAPFPPTTGETE